MTRRLFIITTLFAALLFSTAANAQPRDSWHALPDQTVLVVRAPGLGDIVDQLQRTTKFGRVLLQEERFNRLLTMAKEEDPDGWAQMEADLGKLGLTPQDFLTAWSKPMGAAMTMHDRSDTHVTPLVVFLVWLDGGEELTNKYITAIERGIEDQPADEAHPVRRVDLELAGRKVMHLKVPSFNFSYQVDDAQGANRQQERGFVQPRQVEDWDMDDMPPARNWRYVREHTDQTNIFVTRAGDRLVAAITMPHDDSHFHRAKAENPEAQHDFDKYSSAEQAAGVLARFLEAHDNANHDYAQRILSTPGMAAVMPKGKPVLEIYGDIRPVWELIQKEEEGDEVMRVVRSLGIDGLSTTAIKLSLDGNTMRSGMFLAAPAPRRGLLSMINQAPLPDAPAAWVPANVTNYSHLSFDLGAAYKLVRDIIIDEVGDFAKEGFDTAEAQVQAVTQKDLATVLSGLGNQHTLVEFEPRIADNIEDTKPGDLQRMAIVWQLRDEPAWQAMVRWLSLMQASPVGEFMEYSEEQGFTGWRFAIPDFEAAAMIGRGYLTVAIGNDVTAQILSVLRNAPQGEAALVNSPLRQRLAQVYTTRPGIAYQLADMDRIMQSVATMITAAIIEEFSWDMEEGELAELKRKIAQIIPSREELKGTFDAVGSQNYITDDGLVGDGAILLPE